MIDIYKDLIYLLSCSINDISLDKSRIKFMDLDQLYKLSKHHSVVAIVNIVLEKNGIKDERFHQAYKKSIRKNILLDIERTLILGEFEKNGIWYMPLKGCILKDFYSSDGMRQMADNDILFDETKREEVKNIMLSHGYVVKEFDKSNHDVYMKPPVLNFELHTNLFNTPNIETFNKYYLNIKKMMKKDKNNKFGYHFTAEDFYVYITAHEWKHYNFSGTGIRSLVDCYVYLNNKNDKLDWKYINEQLKQLGISEFEEKRRKLAMKIFSNDRLSKLNDDDVELLTFYLSSGTYGTYENTVKKKLKKHSKISFWVHSIFIPRKLMNVLVPFTEKSPLLYPFGVIYRCFYILFFKRDKIKLAIKVVKKYGK